MHTPPPRRWTAPASLLIAGEYLITEEGGRGISLATGPRGHLHSGNSGAFAIEGHWPGGGLRWNIRDTPGEELPDFLFREMAELNIGISHPETVLNLDTSEFFRSDGSKTGLGSSAVSAVLLSAAALSLCTDTDQARATIPRLALNTHRAFQGGRGSGYDILTSFHGGCGVFTGGTDPVWSPLKWPAGIEVWLLKGGKPVKSRQAVDRYSRWKEDHPVIAADYRLKSASLMDDLLSVIHSNPGSDHSGFLDILRELAIRSRGLGEAIGVPSEPILPGIFSRRLRDDRIPDIVIKCLGAGDELVMLAGTKEAFPEEDRSRLLEMEESGTANAVTPEPDGLKEEFAG